MNSTVPLWRLSSRERGLLHFEVPGQAGDLLRTADKLERARAPYQAADRMRRAAQTIQRLEQELAEERSKK